MRPDVICASYDRSIIGVRWASLWLDIFLRAGIIGITIALSTEHSMVLAITASVIFYVLYYPLLEGLTGQTFGKWVCRLRVVDADGNIPGVWKATIRTLLRLVEINPFLFGGLPAGIATATSPTRQRLGDVIAKTYVVKVTDLMSFPYPSYGAGSESPYDLPQPPQRDLRRPSNRWAGPVIWGLLFMLPGVSLIVSGVQGKQTEAESRQPITMGCKEFLQSPAKQGWYHLTGCPVNMATANYEMLVMKNEAGEANTAADRDASISDVYIPVFSSADQKKTSLILSTDAEPDRERMAEIRKVATTDDVAMRKWVELNRDKILFDKDVTGMVREGSSFSDFAPSGTAEVAQYQLEPKFRILKEGESPRQAFPTAAFGCGTLFCLAAVLCWAIAGQRVRN